jgi:hypothetical protein
VLRFKRFLLERDMSYVPMPPGQWVKVNSQTGEPRLDILRRLIKTGEKVPTVDGTEIVILNNPDNIQAVLKLEKDKKPQTLSTDKGDINTSKIGKSAVFGGASSGSGGGTKQTASAESLQCLYCEFMVNNPTAKFEQIQPSDLKKLLSNKIAGTTMNDMIELDPTWHWSAYWTAKALIKKNLIDKSMKFHRGDNVMKKIYKKKDEAIRNSKNVAFTKLSDDKWNPGDIWAVKDERAIDNLPTGSIQELNVELVKLFKQKKLIGISLKKVVSEKQIKAKILNEEPNADVHKFVGGRLMATFAKKASEFWRSKSAVIEFDEGKADIRTSAEFASINFEITLKTARGGRAGYEQINSSLRKRLGKNVPTNAQLKTIAEDLNKKGERSRYARVFYNMVKRIHPTVTRSEFMEGLITKRASEVHSKIGATYILDSLVANKRNGKADLVITDLVNYAGSKLDISSIYIKVFE